MEKLLNDCPECGDSDEELLAEDGNECLDCGTVDEETLIEFGEMIREYAKNAGSFNLSDEEKQSLLENLLSLIDDKESLDGSDERSN